jgi:hypothetical protein
MAHANRSQYADIFCTGIFYICKYYIRTQYGRKNMPGLQEIYCKKNGFRGMNTQLVSLLSKLETLSSHREEINKRFGEQTKPRVKENQQ